MSEIPHNPDTFEEFSALSQQCHDFAFGGDDLLPRIQGLLLTTRNKLYERAYGELDESMRMTWKELSDDKARFICTVLESPDVPEDIKKSIAQQAVTQYFAPDSFMETQQQERYSFYDHVNPRLLYAHLNDEDKETIFGTIVYDLEEYPYKTPRERLINRYHTLAATKMQMSYIMPIIRDGTERQRRGMYEILVQMLEQGDIENPEADTNRDTNWDHPNSSVFSSQTELVAGTLEKELASGNTEWVLDQIDRLHGINRDIWSAPKKPDDKISHRSSLNRLFSNFAVLFDESEVSSETRADVTERLISEADETDNLHVLEKIIKSNKTLLSQRQLALDIFFRKYDPNLPLDEQTVRDHSGFSDDSYEDIFRSVITASHLPREMQRSIEEFLMSIVKRPFDSQQLQERIDYITQHPFFTVSEVKRELTRRAEKAYIRTFLEKNNNGSFSSEDVYEHFKKKSFPQTITEAVDVLSLRLSNVRNSSFTEHGGVFIAFMNYFRDHANDEVTNEQLIDGYLSS